MTVRNTASLPNTNEFKDAGNAEQCNRILGNMLKRLGQWTERTSEQDLPEAFNEAALTQARNQLSELLTELDVWRTL